MQNIYMNQVYPDREEINRFFEAYWTWYMPTIVNDQSSIQICENTLDEHINGNNFRKHAYYFRKHYLNSFQIIKIALLIFIYKC